MSGTDQCKACETEFHILIALPHFYAIVAKALNGCRLGSIERYQQQQQPSSLP